MARVSASKVALISLVAASLALVTSGAPAGASDGIRLQVQAIGSPPPTSVRFQAGADSAFELLEVPLQGGRGEGLLAVPGEFPIRIRLAEPGYWAPDMVVREGVANVEVTLWPAAALAGALRWDDQGQQVREVQISLVRPASVPESRQPGRAEVSCPVAEGVIQKCLLPAGHWHIRLSAAGLIPHRWWNRELLPAGADLGEIVLAPGASLFGRVTTHLGPADPRATTVEVRPLLDRGTVEREAAPALDQLALTADINEWGYFELHGVPAGVFLVRARAEGFLPTPARRVVVAPRSHVELDEDLVLEPALFLHVEVEPEECPEGKPWSVALLAMEGSIPLREVARGVSEAGLWVSPELTAGEYAVQLLDGSSTPVGWEEVTLTDRSERLRIVLDLVAVKGRVFLGREPLEADLMFLKPGVGPRGSVSTDAEGRFRTSLPEPGRWDVQVVATGTPGETCAARISVEITAANAGDLRIVLPDTSLRGKVVDHQGRPVGGAEVSAVRWFVPGAFSSAAADAGGEFVLRGLPPGEYTLQAAQGGRKSHQVSQTAERDRESAPVTLVLEESWRIAGRVLGSGVPLPQAHVLAIPLAPPGIPAEIHFPEAVTSLSGEFAIELAGSADRARVIVMAPGYAFHTFTALRPTHQDEHPIEANLETASGALRLSSAAIDAMAAGDAWNGIILLGGHPVLGWTLLTWAALNGAVQRDGEGLTIPAMPAGTYSYCELSAEEAFLVLGGAAAPSARVCATGDLLPGMELHLSR